MPPVLAQRKVRRPVKSAVHHVVVLTAAPVVFALTLERLSDDQGVITVSPVELRCSWKARRVDYAPRADSTSAVVASAQRWHCSKRRVYADAVQLYPSTYRRWNDGGTRGTQRITS